MEKKRKTKLTREDKIDLIIEAMIENPGARHRRGFQKNLIDAIHLKEGVKVDASQMAKMVKVAVERMSKDERYFMSKREYQLQHQRLLSELKKAQDRVMRALKVENIDQLSDKQRREYQQELRITIRELANLSEAQRRTLHEMAQIDGHLKELHEHRVVDDKDGDELTRMFQDGKGKPEGKGKEAVN